MRKIWNKILIIFFIIFSFSCNKTFAAQSATIKNINNAYPSLQTSLPLISTAPNDDSSIKFRQCCKYFKINNQKLFYLTLAGIVQNRFEIDEIQSQSGYIIFSVSQQQFLASIITIDINHSMLKIVPCNNIYSFSLSIVQNIYQYIELNIYTQIQQLKVT